MRTWRLGRRPALDGLRGTAVLMVLAAHLIDTTAAHPFGQAGVVVFFVLSGFLITSLLADELETRGRISLLGFYARRARRLAPALVVLVAAVTLLALVLQLGPWWTSPRAVLGALSWTSNYVSPSTIHGEALSHTWSLAIEEQFYLIWPLLLLGLTRLPWAFQRALLTAAVGIGAALPFMLLNAGPWHVYYGTDTRSLPLLAGCLLALAMRRRPEGSGSAAVAVVGLLVLFAACLAWSGRTTSGWLLPQLTTAVTVTVIWASCQQQRVPMLTAPWIRWVGGLSYSLYLWHRPLTALAEHAGLGVGARLLTVLPASFAAAWLSWTLVERRFHHGTWASSRMPPVPEEMGVVAGAVAGSAPTATPVACKRVYAADPATAPL